MANNFFLNQDPLLFQNPYKMEGEDTLYKQYNDAMQQYKMLQQQNTHTQSDYVGELDRLLKGISTDIIERLNNNEEYSKLNNELTEIMQKELIANIKWKINMNPVAIKNIERQTEIINVVSHEVEKEQRQSLNEINDYVKNYSNITFDDYRKIKNGETVENKKPTKHVKNESK